ncbi:MAG: MFS transporter, partial [Defluviitaleaceae bacterium]|nr:MFS transporter [Defluviitaleaceae bacterium]
MVVVLVSNFCMLFGATAINIAVPHIGVEFGVSATMLNWVLISMLLVTVVLSIPLGRVADIYGRTWMFKGGALLSCAASVLIAVAPNMTLFLLFRVLQGVGFSMIFATGIAILADAFPADRRGSAIGLSSAAVFVGQACGPPVGGLLTQAFGWRSIFFALATLMLVAFVVAMVSLQKDGKPSAPETRKKINTSSIVLFILAFSLLMYGLSSLTQNIWSYPIFAAGVIMIIVFV